MIDDFLAENKDEYDQVLTIDVRDSMFQGDPFSDIIVEDGLYISQDVPTKTIGECSWNGGWVEACFGTDTLNSLSKRPIYCSGVSLGEMAVMRKYTKLMREKILSPDFPKCERNGVDQGKPIPSIRNSGHKQPPSLCVNIKCK